MGNRPEGLIRTVVEKEEKKTRIRRHLASVRFHILQSVWLELKYRFDACRFTNDTHIEHLRV
jgi:hypothetical protein